MPHPDKILLRINADAAIDAQGVVAAPASLLLEVSPTGSPSVEVLGREVWRGKLRVVACGTPGDVDKVAGAGGAVRIARPGCVLIPGLVNAHMHLDLTHIGPRDFDAEAGFLGFVRTVLGNRLADEGAIAASIARGAALSLAGGVVCVGDIGGVVEGKPSLACWRGLAKTALTGVSYVEFFGSGAGEAGAVRELTRVIEEGERESAGTCEAGGVRLGISPHAPYTVGLGAYRAAHELARAVGSRVGDRARGLAGQLPVSTHLAENPEEREFVAHGRGAFRGFLERIGAWDDARGAEVGRGATPVEHLRHELSRAAVLAAHVNDASDTDIATLRACGASVVYSPRSSAYFRNHEHFGAHRYRDMIAAGIPVCLGTDSVINLPSAERISTLDEARFLSARDGTDPRTLLAMCTTMGAQALGLRESRFLLRGHSTANSQSEVSGEIAGVVAVPVRGSHADAFDAVTSSDSAPELLAIGEGLA